MMVRTTILYLSQCASCWWWFHTSLALHTNLTLVAEYRNKLAVFLSQKVRQQTKLLKKIPALSLNTMNVRLP